MGKINPSGEDYEKLFGEGGPVGLYGSLLPRKWVFAGTMCLSGFPSGGNQLPTANMKDTKLSLVSFSLVKLKGGSLAAAGMRLPEFPGKKPWLRPSVRPCKSPGVAPWPTLSDHRRGKGPLCSTASGLGG